MTVVSNASELLAALANASPGDTIELTPGDYGNVILDGYNFTGTVTITSQLPNSAATFDTLFVKNSSYLKFDNVVVHHALADGEPDWSSAFRIDKSDHITVANSEISGSADENHTNDGQGLLVLDSSNVKVDGNAFHDLKTGVSVGRSTYIDVTNNSFTDIRSDGADFANVRHVLVDGNTFTNFHPAFDLGDHPDMIQIWNDGSFGDTYDIAISNNELIQGDGGNVQGIFVQGALAQPDGSVPSPLHDLIISGNAIDIGAAQGIWLSDVDAALVSDNTVTQASGGISTPSIRTDHTSNTTVEYNNAPQIDDVGSTNLIYNDNTITAEAPSGSTIQGTSGGDTLFGSTGDDTILGGNGNDTAWGSDGNDRINGESGDDLLYGDDGNDSLNGGGGNDELHGGKGNDGFFGGGGNDRLFGEGGNDVMFGDGGNDMLNGGGGDDQMHGGSGNDGFFGGGGNDTIYGDDGDDTIYGDGGNDVIDGGRGNDTFIGGAGADTFVFGFGAGSDRILDFQSGSDLLDFSGLTTVASIDDLDIVQLGTKAVTISYFDGVIDVVLEIDSSSPIILDTTDFLF
ncbi:MAG: right-handed parallel beta-helix repeat-containing protein [Hyphomicrobiaceae bacterium]